MNQAQRCISVNGKDILLDKNGYLSNMSQWSEELALALAKQEQMVLSDKHWEVIYFVREFYQTYDTSPAIRALVKAMKDKFGPEVGNSRYLHRLFPDGPAKLATKLAGLPKPAKCL
ncbi:TusE/DsrC/DsvC family sulfur relay protein [Glaciecola sp. SC05]|uniref:TusE/DsrC/DsvC family sulfur relay protein n=1 Tax=Glaciecola sp. SC05 TaxID=1987355 RepID=UPI0035274C6A